MLVCVINTLLVLHYGNNQFSFNETINQFLSQLNNLFRETINPQHTNELNKVIVSGKLITEATINPDNVHRRLDETSKSVTHRHSFELETIGGSCASPINMSKQKAIYQWQDENGITTISDKPRQVLANTSVRLIGIIQPEMISINYHNSSTSMLLRNTINARVIKAKEIYTKVVPKHLVKPVQVNFRLFKKLDLYKNYQKRVAPTLVNSTGFYMGSTNQSVVMMHSEAQGINTAVHEAIHAINRHWFGSMSKWLNEGIAEYAETDLRLPITDNSWFSFIRKQPAIPLRELFKAGKKEWSSQSQVMYATSWAFIAYLMQEQPTLLSRLLMEENYNDCAKLNIQDIERISGKSVGHLQGEFNLWLKLITQ